MDLSTTSPSSLTLVADLSSASNQNDDDDTQTSGNLYDTALDADALENVTEYSSFNGCETLNDSSLIIPTADIIMDCGADSLSVNKSIILLPQSESTETNTSLDDVDPKSLLANKTIFKTDNPNLSIIEISDSSVQDIGDSIILIESSTSDDDEKYSVLNQKKSSKILVGDGADNAMEKRRKKAESFIQSSKQKLNLAIAEASATESNIKSLDATQEHSERNDAMQGANQLETKKDIKIYDTLEEFDKNLPSTVTILDTPFGSKVYLVGTAHFSEQSQDDVSYVIRNVKPDVVMVELCPSRVHILKLDEKTLLEEAKNFNLAKVRSILKAHGYINGIFFILLLQMSAQIAKDLGMAPGGEFRRAFEEIHKLPGCMLHLGDRPIRVTLNRALHALSLWQTLKLVWRLTSTDTISIEEVEECKQQDLLEKLMQEMAGEFPAFSEVFVKERDMFLCHSLQLAALPQASVQSVTTPRPVRVVGVVGIGHANGIAKLWGRVDPQKIPEIMEIPPPSTSTIVCKFTIKYGLIGLTLFGVFKVLRPRIIRFF